jgi:hypothetical protein
VRRRYDVQYNQATRQYVVELWDEQGHRRQVETFSEWGSADHLRGELNRRLEQTGQLLPESRR